MNFATTQDTSFCFICGDERVVFNAELSNPHGLSFNCPYCGAYRVDSLVGKLLAVHKNLTTKRQKAVLRYFVTNRANQDEVITANKLEEILDKDELPNVLQKWNSLILYLGQVCQGLGLEGRIEKPLLLCSKLGILDENELNEFLNEFKNQAFFTQHITGAQYHHTADSIVVSMSLKFWIKYNEILEQTTPSKTAFMALKFDQDLSLFVDKVIKPTVYKTGFTLGSVQDGQTSGLIDDHIRIKIRQSRFVIVDLSHGNQGAYFEAGFAEGLNKPVIYVCEKKAFDKKRGKKRINIHFDVEHHNTLRYEYDKPEKFEQELKDLIRNTLPDEAIMADKQVQEYTVE